MSVVEIAGLTKKYGDNVAIEDISFSIDENGVYGFLGPNGAGKSTTMNIITGYIGASSGSVTIDGFDIFREPEKAKRNIGYLPEIPPVYPEMTAMEYLQFAADLKKVPKKERKQQIDKAVEMTGIDQVSDRLIKNLSKGYKQRVGIAQAILGMPKLIILDEPTVGLDPQQIIEIRSLIKNLGKDHIVILSSHILTEISEVCDKMFIISRGKLVAYGSEDELIEQLGGDNEVSLTLLGSVSTDAFSNCSFVSDVKSESDEDGNTSVTVISESDGDIRKDIFDICISNNMTILEMIQKKKSLENIFIELTQEYSQSAAKHKKKLTKEQIAQLSDNVGGEE